jgi:hypothetical protein
VASPSKSESGGMRGGLQNDRLLVAALLECAQQKSAIALQPSIRRRWRRQIWILLEISSLV